MGLENGNTNYMSKMPGKVAAVTTRKQTGSMQTMLTKTSYTNMCVPGYVVHK